ncbi:MAG: hypothetical protein ACOX3J_05990 [Clostridia bacterium]|jgi:predicted membrane protein
MNFFKRFMHGRYGMDQLSFTLLIIALIILIISRLLLPILGYFALAIVVYAYYRFFSKDIKKRQGENMKFLSVAKPMQMKIKNKRLLIFGTKTHKYYKCPKCKQMLRVPKNKGLIQITCSRCKKEFIKKT